MHPSPHDLLVAFDRAIGGDDAVAMTDLFASDAELLFANNAPAVGRAAIHDYWAEIFSANETSDASMECPLLHVHGDQAYAVCTYEETVRNRAGGPARRLFGRAAFFLRREAQLGWRIALAMNSPARPAEVVE